jgi:carbamoyl-phosphate synthase large subunit
MNILITSSSKKVLLVKSFKKNLSEFSEGNIVCTDISSDAITFNYSDKHYNVSKTNSELFINEIFEICKTENIKLIIPTSDTDVNFFATNKNLFKNIYIMVSDINTVNICQNKKKFNEFCIENNFDIPKTYNEINEINLPLFCKPIFGNSSRNLYKIMNKIELNNFLENNDINNFIIQELINDNYSEFTIDYFGDFNGNFIDLVIRNRLEIINGESTISEIIINDLIYLKCKDIGTKLYLIGHNNIQLFYNKNNNDIKFIEINNRFGGCSNLSIESGLNSIKYMLELIKYGKCNINKIYENKVYKYTNDLILSKITSNKIYCIDIDGTICTETYGKYDDCKPISKVINKINELYNNNNTIILYTARGAKSGYNWYDYTKKQIDSWDIKYHTLLMGKPFADFYIDNKAINIFDWI